MPVGDNRRPAPDNVVPYADQALLLALRGAGQEAVMQIIWIYEHDLDLDGVRRFHQNFGRGLVGRVIERSPLPFGRHRWVSVPGPQTALDIAEQPRPRDELCDWAHEQVELPLDPEWGPAWRMGVQSFTDGTSAVSLVVSHTVVDGGGVVASVDRRDQRRRQGSRLSAAAVPYPLARTDRGRAPAGGGSAGDLANAGESGQGRDAPQGRAGAPE